MKTIILYYSRTRKTAQVAETLQRELKSDIIEIKDAKNRNNALNYMGAAIDAFRENKTRIIPQTVDLSSYGLIYVGTPVWAAKPTPAIVSMIDSCDFQGKDVIIFVTAGRSGTSRTIQRMKEKIELRGGRMITHFAIKTSGKELYQLDEETNKIIDDLDLKIYQS